LFADVEDSIKEERKILIQERQDEIKKAEIDRIDISSTESDSNNSSDDSDTSSSQDSSENDSDRSSIEGVPGSSYGGYGYCYSCGKYELHPPEIRGFCSSFCPAKTHQNLLYFYNKKTHVVFFVFHFEQLYLFH
jgi:hypothetical protein